MKDFLKYFRMGVMACIAALAMVSCSDDDNTEPNKPNEPEVPVVVDTQGAHFDADNETSSILFSSQENRTVTYTLSRNKAEDELTINLDIINATEGLKVPTTVTFAKDSLRAHYQVVAPANAKDGDTYSFEVSIQNADEYAQGATRFSATIAFPIKHYARMWFTGLIPEYGYFLNEVYELDGSYLFPNFLQSGTDLTVRYDKDATELHECDVMTLPSLNSADADNPGCYYLYCWQELEDDENGIWTTFYPHGQDARVKIEAMTYYVSHDGYQATVYNPEAKSGWIALSTVEFWDNEKEVETELNWQYLNWVLVDDPANDGFDYSEPAPIVVDTNALAKFAGTWTFTGTDAYCSDESMTPASSYQCEFMLTDDGMIMNGLLGTAYDTNGENPSAYTVKYNAEDNTITLINGSVANGSYVWDDITQNWYYTYDLTLNVGEDEDGNLILTRDKTWYFYALGDDWLDASYGTMKFVKNKE